MSEYAIKNQSAVVLTQEMLGKWAEKSGIQKRAGQRAGYADKYNIACLDMPMSVFPMLLRPNKKYVMSLANYHNLHPGQRTDMLAKLQHGLNVKSHVLVSVDNIVETVDENKSVLPAIREHYEIVKIPSEDEGYTSITYVSNSEANQGKTQEELKEKVAEKFVAWKKDCKLKSK